MRRMDLRMFVPTKFSPYRQARNVLGSTKGIDQSTGFGQYGQLISKFVYKI